MTVSGVVWILLFMEMRKYYMDLFICIKKNKSANNIINNNEKGANNF